MKALDALNIINDISSSQKGLFTSAQTTSLGIDRMTLSRLAAHGQIEPIARGVYKAAAAPTIREEDVYAAWLATDPATPSYLRPLDASTCVASLGTAAWLHGLGELKPEPITFSCSKRKQSRNASVRFLKRTLPNTDVCTVAGIPATTPARTILDLLDYGEDLSLVASVLRDAEQADSTMEIGDEVNSRAAKCGFGKKFDLYAYLRKG
ncbi:MAG: type IV toxin-antitoxin system AbiEi family antitoxin domain-containing protein [Coriobacteriales bacterium]|jgi:predicted transcriptional regulator of viral defense system